MPLFFTSKIYARGSPLPPLAPLKKGGEKNTRNSSFSFPSSCQIEPPPPGEKKCCSRQRFRRLNFYNFAVSFILLLLFLKYGRYTEPHTTFFRQLGMAFIFHVLTLSSDWMTPSSWLYTYCTKHARASHLPHCYQGRKSIARTTRIEGEGEEQSLKT